MMISSPMRGGTSWGPNPFDSEMKSSSQCEEFGEPDTTCFIASIPDDLLGQIFSFLPVAMMFRLASVCRKWNEMVHSKRISLPCSLVQKPWYFMFTSDEAAAGHAYDPSLRRWYKYDLPCVERSNWFVSSSAGLVCLIDNDDRSRIYVCNPITRDWKMIKEPPGREFPDYITAAISMNGKSRCYTLAVIKSKQVPNDFLQWDFSVHVFNSELQKWTTPIDEVFLGWRGGDECVICNGVLYCLIYSTGLLGNGGRNHGLITYDLWGRTWSMSLLDTLVHAPCSLTCGRLMNLRESLVMVGGIGKQDRPGILKGIGIWEFNFSRKEWREITKMPHRLFQGFGEFDDVFASSGSDTTVYIQSYGSSALLMFDISLKQWKWAVKCPVSKRFPLQLFTGFCFEPHLDVDS